jgi:hypothetical protein
LGCGRAGALLSTVDRSSSVLTSLVGLLLFTYHGWGCCCYGTSGGDWPGLSNFCGLAAIVRVELLLVLGSGLSHLTLLGQSGGANLAAGSQFRRTWLDVDASAPTVIAHGVAGAAAVGDVVVDDRAVVDVGDAANVGDTAVVIEVIAVPIATEVADADVAEAVVDTTVEADVGAPVTAVEAIAAAIVAPVGRRPESAVIGGRAPNAGHPVVASRAPCPVAGSPHVIGFGSGWLVVLRQRGRGLVGIFVDGIFAGIFSRLILIVVALDDGGGSLLLVAFALLLGSVGGIFAENLRVGGWGEVRISGVGIAAGRSSAIVDGCGSCGVGRAVFAAHKANGEQRGCAYQAKSSYKRAVCHRFVLTPARPKSC